MIFQHFWNSIKGKIIILFSILLLVSFGSLFFLQTTYNSVLESSLRTNNRGLAIKIMETVEQQLIHHIDTLEAFTYLPSLQAGIRSGNPHENQVDQATLDWSTDSSYYHRIEESELSKFLVLYFDERSFQKYGYSIFAEVFVTDRDGHVLAATNKTEHFVQREEDWWKQAKKNGFYVSNIVFDDSAGIHGIEVAIAIQSDSGEFLGVITGILNFNQVIQESKIGLGVDIRQRIELSTAIGELIYSTDLFVFREDLSQRTYFPSSTVEDLIDTQAETLYSYAYSRNLRPIGDLGWILIMSTNLTSVLAPVYSANISILIFLASLLVFSVGFSFGIIRSINQPLRIFERGAKQIAEGDLDYQFEVMTNTELIGLASVFNNMTKRLKKLYLNLEQKERKATELTNDLRRSNKDLEQFAYIASHDLQEPLRKITAFGSLLLDEKKEHLDEEGQKYIEIMNNAAGRMSALINSLLQYSRISSKTMEHKSVALREVLENALDNLDFRVKESSARITIGENLPKVWGDTSQLTQIFQNLISNSLKFHIPAKEPAITIQREVSSDPEWVNISVSDQGIGIPTDKLEEIFQPFKKLHSRSQYAGTGIGLAYCRKIMERLGGRIIAVPAEESGAKFLLSFLMREGEQR